MEVADFVINGLNIAKPKIRSIDYVVIGGGPVGFESALGLFRKIQTDPLNESCIYIFEKRIDNTREQVLYMQTEYWNDLPIEIKRYINDQGGLCLISSPNFCYGSTEAERARLEASQYSIHPDMPLYSYVKLSTLQDAYIEYFRNHGYNNGTRKRIVYIVYPIEGDNSNLEYYKSLESNLFIVCDGVGGTVSREICGGKHTIKVSHAAVITFDFNMRPGITPEIFKNSLNLNFNGMQYKQNSVISFYTKKPDGSYSGYIGMQLSQDTFNDINRKFIESRDRGDNRSKFQIFIDDVENRYIEKVLYNNIVENVITNVQNQDMTIFDITLTSSVKFYHRFGDKYFFLTGDAAFTTHFFTGTGMNRGISSSIVLMNLLTNFSDNKEYLATLYSIILQQIRNKLWKTQIPFMLYDFGAIMNTCRAFPNTIEKVNCIYQNTLSREYYGNSLTPQGQQLVNYVDTELESSYNNNIILLNNMPNNIENIINDVLASNREPNYNYQVSAHYLPYFTSVNYNNIPHTGIQIATGGKSDKYYNKYLKYKQKYLSIKKLKK